MAITVCVNCNLELRMKQRGVAAELMSTFGAYQLYSADLYECPSCHLQVVAGLGSAPIAHHHEPDYQSYVRAQAQMGHVPFWRTAKEKQAAEEAGVPMPLARPTLRSAEDFQKAHDLFVAIILGEVPNPFIDESESDPAKRELRQAVILQCGHVLCWALQHAHNPRFEEQLHTAEEALAQMGFAVHDAGSVKPRQAILDDVLPLACPDGQHEPYASYRPGGGSPAALLNTCGKCGRRIARSSEDEPWTLRRHPPRRESER